MLEYSAITLQSKYKIKDLSIEEVARIVKELKSSDPQIQTREKFSNNLNKEESIDLNNDFNSTEEKVESYFQANVSGIKGGATCHPSGKVVPQKSMSKRDLLMMAKDNEPEYIYHINDLPADPNMTLRGGHIKDILSMSSKSLTHLQSNIKKDGTPRKKENIVFKKDQKSIVTPQFSNSGQFGKAIQSQNYKPQMDNRKMRLAEDSFEYINDKEPVTVADILTRLEENPKYSTKQPLKQHRHINSSQFNCKQHNNTQVNNMQSNRNRHPKYEPRDFDFNSNNEILSSVECSCCDVDSSGILSEFNTEANLWKVNGNERVIPIPCYDSSQGAQNNRLYTTGKTPQFNGNSSSKMCNTINNRDYDKGLKVKEPNYYVNQTQKNYPNKNQKIKSGSLLSSYNPIET